MKYIFLTILAFVIFLGTFSNTISSQENKNENNSGLGSTNDSASVIDEKTVIPDTVCFRYNFFKGDTLIFTVTTTDSMIHNMDQPILKSRVDELQVTCDSVDVNKNFYMELKILKSTQKEWTNSTDTVVHSSIPWIGKRALLVIDSIGNRKQAKLLDSNYIVTSPGGVFQPYIFFSLSEQCVRVGKSWLTKSIDTLYENAYPPALLEQTSLFRAKEKVVKDYDTLAKLTYVKTGKGYYSVNSDEIKINMQDVINTYGELTINMTEHIPVKYAVTQEEKMHLFLEDGSQIPTWHFTDIMFDLKSFARDFNQIEKDILKIRNELKKKTK